MKECCNGDWGSWLGWGDIGELSCGVRNVGVVHTRSVLLGGGGRCSKLVVCKCLSKIGVLWLYYIRWYVCSMR